MSSPSRRHRVVLLLTLTLLATLSAAVPGKKNGTATISDSGLNGKLRDNQRRLRTRAHAEERGFSVTALAEAMSKKPSNQKQVTQLFTKVEKGYSKANMNSEQATKAIVSTLAAKYSDERLVEMMVAAKKVSSTKKMATKLEAAQMQNWLSNKVSADDAFQFLKLDLKRSSVLESPQLKNWINYMDMSKDDPYKWLLEGLLKLDDNSAIRTAGMLGATKQNSDASPIAQNVEDLLLQSWMPNTADDIFKRLALNKQGEQLFENPAIVTRAAFATKLDKQNAGESMLSVLKATYRDEVLLSRMLAAAKERDSTKTIATNLEKAQFKDWSSTGKSTDDVFDLLKLDRQTDSMDELLKSPLLGT
uniref:Avh161.2 n=1 Tax=Phytophthora sojae TaxID=67593 RepID=G1FRQ7_PHYSO|nr:Avh161.2 [Phytophthora sojae]